MAKLRRELIGQMEGRNVARAADLVYYFSAWDTDRDILSRRFQAFGETDGARTLTTSEAPILGGPDGQVIPTAQESEEDIMRRHAFDDIDHPETEEPSEEDGGEDEDAGADDATLDPNAERR